MSRIVGFAILGIVSIWALSGREKPTASHSAVPSGSTTYYGASAPVRLAALPDASSIHDTPRLAVPSFPASPPPPDASTTEKPSVTIRAKKAALRTGPRSSSQKAGVVSAGKTAIEVR